MTLSIPLPEDPNGFRVQGVGGYLPAGTRVGSTDYAVQHILLVDANDNPLLVSVAHDAVDSGNGIKIQGHAVSTGPAAVSDNDRVNVWVDTFGRVVTVLKTTNAVDIFSTPTIAADNIANPTAGGLLNFLMAWQGTTWERVGSLGGAIKVVATLSTNLIGKVALTGKTSATGDTEIEAIASNADAASNTANQIRASTRPSWFNGTSWDRARAAPVDGTTFGSTGAGGSSALLTTTAGWFSALAASVLSDGNTSNGYGGATPMLFNGSNFDRQHNNLAGTLLASSARTTTTASGDQTNYNGEAAHVMVNVSSYSSGGLTAHIQGKDPVSGSYYDILVGTKITATGLVVLKVGPGVLSSPGAAAQDMVPRTWRINVVPDDATSITYSVGYALNAA